MTTLVVAEKPSVARNIARILGASRSGEGFLYGNGYIVTWALGHLVRLAEPDEYNEIWSRRWSAQQLPMIPEEWKLQVVSTTAKQLKVIQGLLQDPQVEQLVCATDAGREGEHIFRLILEKACCQREFSRLWVSSLTDEAIREGFRTLQPGSAFDALAQAARARAQADWLVGMNLTRAYTIHNGVLCTIGRVQTPTLAMIVKRDKQIASFHKTYFYELLAHMVEGFTAKYSDKGQTRIDNKAEAERLWQRLNVHTTGKVLKVEQKKRHNRPPPLYDLNNLQREGNRRFGYTAAQILAYAQELYERHKLISYPRTESRHISEDMMPELPGILKKLNHPQVPEASQRWQDGYRPGKAYVDRTKLTDHHAIMPTGTSPSPGLGPALASVYDLVVCRFVAVFLPDQIVEETRVNLDIGGALFVARGSKVLEKGWKVVEQRDPNKSKEASQILPPLQKGQIVQIAKMEVKERETQPPRPYNDATLLAAMKNAGRELEDDTLAEAMKLSGLGTAATRAEMIEKLIRTGYILRERKQLRATEKGNALISVVSESLCSPELTGEWERRLKEVEEGTRPVEEFYRDIVDFVCTWVPEVAKGAAMSPEQVAKAREQSSSRSKGKLKSAGLGVCPTCNQGDILKTPKGYGCSQYREGCHFTIWETVASLKLTTDQVKQLSSQGYTDKIEGFTSKTGKKFAARLKLDKAGKIIFDFNEGPLEKKSQPAQEPEKTANQESVAPTCPKCSLGSIIKGKRGYGCNRYREGCDFVVWQEISGKKLTQKQIYGLIRTGRTRFLKGFKAQTDEKFEARLRLNKEGGVEFESKP